MSDQAIGLVIYVLIVLLVLAILALRRKDRKQREYFARLEAIRKVQRDGSDAWKNERRGYKR